VELHHKRFVIFYTTPMLKIIEVACNLLATCHIIYHSFPSRIFLRLLCVGSKDGILDVLI
jgi:hypothetical protein